MKSMSGMAIGVVLVTMMGCEDARDGSRQGNSPDGSDEGSGQLAADSEVSPSDGCGPSQSVDTSGNDSGTCGGFVEPDEGPDGDDGSDGSDDDSDGTDDGSSDTGQMCYADFPCFGWLAHCTDDPGEIVRMRDVGCHEVCGAGPCSGGACHEAGRERCQEGSVCVPESIDGGSGSIGAACRPLAEVCGGPEGIACAEGFNCEYAAADQYGSPCESLLAQRYGTCRSLAVECEDAEADVPQSCGCTVIAGQLVTETYGSDCARRRAGAALADEWECRER